MLSPAQCSHSQSYTMHGTHPTGTAKGERPKFSSQSQRWGCCHLFPHLHPLNKLPSHRFFFSQGREFFPHPTPSSSSLPTDPSSTSCSLLPHQEQPFQPPLSSTCLLRTEKTLQNPEKPGGHWSCCGQGQLSGGQCLCFHPIQLPLYVQMKDTHETNNPGYFPKLIAHKEGEKTHLFIFQQSSAPQVRATLSGGLEPFSSL